MRVVFRALTTRKLQLLPENNRVAVEKYTVEFVQDLLDVVRPYPPVPPPPNRYKRTFQLEGGWRIGKSFTASGLYVSLYNVKRYARFVQGLDQYWYHARTGWKVVQDYVDRDAFHTGLTRLYRDFRIGEQHAL